MKLTGEEIIELFRMKPLPDEGGYYVETYRASEKIPHSALPQRYSGRRSFSTAIMYLITDKAFSKLHRVRSDEVFHFYLGDPVIMLQLYPNGSGKIVELGRDIDKGRNLQATVPAGVWQGTMLKEGGRCALLGCTVAPGFEFADYESAKTDELLREYPDHRELIVRLAGQR